MAAFSYQYHPTFLVDSSTPAFMLNINTSSPPPPLPSNLHPIHHDQSSKITIMSDHDNESSVTKNNISPQSSMVLDRLESGEQVTQKVVTPIMEKKKRTRNGPSSSNLQSSKDNIIAAEGKNKKQKKKREEDKGKAEEKKDHKKCLEEPPTGYIHVRARRGQATDSHSLAERVRREKISERMKKLQQLVPGCDKVTGKALMLDEIINYVQSLQNQVEFLSMKLTSVNPMFYDLSTDLDSLLVRQEKLNCLASATASPLSSSVSHSLCNSPNHATTFADTNNTIFQTADYLLDTSPSFFLQGQTHQRSNLVSQDNGIHLWDEEDQRQKFFHSHAAGLFSNNLCSFHCKLSSQILP